MKRTSTVLAVLTIALAASNANASGMRCGNNVVHPGEHKITVRKKCGPPAYTEQNDSVWIYVLPQQRFSKGLKFSHNGRLQFIEYGPRL